MFGFLKSYPMKSCYPRPMRLVSILCLSVFCLGFMSPAFAGKAIFENFVGSACVYIADHEENIQTLSDFYEDDLVVLTCPMDDTIWDKEDKEVAAACKDRKTEYLRQDFITSGAPPVVVINGYYMTRGNYRKAINSGVKLAMKTDQIGEIDFRMSDETLIGELPRLDKQGQYELWLIAFDRKKVGNIEVQENQQHEHNADGSHVDPSLDNNDAAHEPVSSTVSIEFNNVVRALDKLGDWSGNQESFVIPLNGFEADGFMVIAQEKNYGPIVATGQAFWPSNQKNQ